ncbi:hypothetical protein TVAG_146840 [Trichomonas vaginalis G3]|uniref:DUF3447 domain-containing protein n=1 Tax=Trichomonas vaginalis (strain ATCC PRA-98 / G3) TaxID=412133 RepID=A2DKY8_TRIV3|nr:protein ubiquitination [Trichomonas vaginalis G3]EAY18941.1 hypothetical protein TVAG_146840 [Trichomonas vaginalis G3]KAI5532007.1 protein ubiquitination [Trichomonas vaginalis G3]|eukprot:XP_001579927.1 hypothetical protein [Trichomonas vaginalis G3]
MDHVAFDETLCQPIINLTNMLFNISNKNIQQCVELINDLITKKVFHIITFIKLLDRISSYKIKNTILYLDIFNSIYKKNNFTFNSEYFPSGSTFGAIILRKYGLKCHNPKYEQYSIDQLYKIFPEEEDKQYLLTDDIDSLLDYLNKKNETSSKILHYAARLGAVKCFKHLASYFKLKDKYNNVSQSTDTEQEILQEAFIGGNIQIINLCINYYCVYPDDKCIENAVYAHNNEIATYFAEEKQLSYSWQSCFVTLNFEMFLKKLNDSENKNSEIQLQAIFLIPRINIPGITNYFKAKNIDLNLKNHKNETLLMHCAIYGNADLAKYLISKGVDVNAKSEDNLSALMFAAINNTSEVAEVILSDPNVNMYDTAIDNVNSLMLCGLYNSPDVARVLIAKGYDVNKAALNNYTPIVFAAMGNSYETAKILIESGCNLNLVFNNGTKVLDIAKSYHSDDVKALIESYL